MDAVLQRSPVLIAVPSGIGAKDPGCGAGPAELLSGGLLERLAARGAPLRLGATVMPSGVRGHSVYRAVADLCGRLAREVGDTIEEGGFPVVLGGDHSCAIGTWSGVANELAARGPIGLVWVDAHMDSHTPATTHSGMPHGMPLAALLGRGGSPKVPREIGSIPHEGSLAPENVCLVGVRSFEPEEARLLTELGITVFGMDEIERRGITAVLEDAIDIASTGTVGYGISLDIDAIDPGEAPGVGTPVPGGLPARPLIDALHGHARDPRLLALEVVEYNPHRDPAGRTAVLVEDVIAALLG